MLCANLIIYGDAKAVMIVTTLNIGRTEEVIAPTSCPPFAMTRDISPFALANPKPALSRSMLSNLDLANTAKTSRSFDANAVNINIIAGIMNMGITEILTKAPMDIKNKQKIYLLKVW